MENDPFDFLKMFEYAHLYKAHPNFDKYPKSVQEALIQNEIIQGRIKRPN